MNITSSIMDATKFSDRLDSQVTPYSSSYVTWSSDDQTFCHLNCGHKGNKKEGIFNTYAKRLDKCRFY